MGISRKSRPSRRRPPRRLRQHFIRDGCLRFIPRRRRWLRRTRPCQSPPSRAPFRRPPRTFQACLTRPLAAEVFPTPRPRLARRTRRQRHPGQGSRRGLSPPQILTKTAQALLPSDPPKAPVAQAPVTPPGRGQPQRPPRNPRFRRRHRRLPRQRPLLRQVGSQKAPRRFRACSRRRLPGRKKLPHPSREPAGPWRRQIEARIKKF